MAEISTYFESREVTVEHYASRWLETVSRELRPKTARSYRQLFMRHIAPTLGALQIQKLCRAEIKLLLAEKRDAGLSRNTVRLIRACLLISII
jgi:hypothetical protein